MKDFIWEKFDNPKLLELKNTCKLDEIISNYSDEFSQQLALNKFVHDKLPLGGAYKDYSLVSSFEILADLEKGEKFRCTQFTQLLLQTATSLGWYIRKLSVDVDHEKEDQDMHHGVCDIWSNKFNKWYVLDPMHNLHYEKNEVPLNSFEIRNEYLENNAVNVAGSILGSDAIKYNKNSSGINTPSNYFWFCISQRNNFFEEPGIFNTNTYLWIDEYNKHKKWYKNGQLHDMYNGRFIEIVNKEKIFPKI